MTPVVGTAKLVGSYKTGSPEWHAARARGLGGSEIAAVLGLSPFESRFSLYHRKTGLVGPVEVSPEMEWGTRLEPVIIAKFLEVHPEYIGAGTATYRHTERPWQVTNPDQLLTRQNQRFPHALLETKFSMYGDGWGETGTDDIPVHVRTQVLWYLDIFGFDLAHVAVLVGGCDYREYPIAYDPTEAQLLRDAGRKFLDDVANGVRPDIDAHTATYQTIRDMHPDIDPVTVELTVNEATDFVVARRRLQTAKDVEQAARSVVADHMGTAVKATWQGQTIARRQARGEGVPYVVAAKNLPPLVHPQGEAAA